ncbi:MAG TPA: twin-arginine translocase TatA/TatE family subunit [Acidobacteriota bacterium]
MFLIGPLGHQELLIILALALLIFGAKKLPDLGKSLGEGIKNFKKSISGKEKDDASSDKPVPPPKDE